VTTALHLLQIAIVCLIVMGLVWACRFVWRRSRLAGLMLAAGLAIRVCGGAFFLAVSYFEWPLLTSLQMGNGFWTLAPDAQEYYRMGSLVADHWQLTTTRGYVGPLGYWMRAVGVNPASPVLFAIVMYTLGVVTLVMAFGRNRTRAADQALHLSVAAISFTPMLVYSAVFGLKDVFFTTLVVIMAVAYLTLLVGTAWTRTTRTTTLAVAAVGIPAVFLIAGTRAYFAILLFAAIGVTYAACVLAGVPSRRRAVAQAAVVLPALALTIVLGAEGGYPLFLRNLIVGAVGIPNVVVVHPAPIATGLEELDRRRDAIDKYGGNSMLSRRGRKTRSDSFPAAKADADSFPAAKAGADGLPAAATGSDGRRRAGRRLPPQPRHRKAGGRRPPDQHGGAVDRRRGHGDVRRDGRADPLAGDRQPQRNQLAAARVRAGARRAGRGAAGLRDDQLRDADPAQTARGGPALDPHACAGARLCRTALCECSSTESITCRYTGAV
jgi:hypothetical protein